MESVDQTKSGLSADGSGALTSLKARWSVYSLHDLKQRIDELGSDKYLIDGLIPDRSLGILVGDSGLGKSPLLYQMAVCVACGLPFLGHAVRQGHVLCLDFENGLGQVHDIIAGLSAYLGVAGVPSNLHLWNFNDCSERYGEHGHAAFDMIRDIKPSLVIADALTGLYPEIEKDNWSAVKAIQAMRTVIKDTGTAIVGVQHIRKPSEKPEYKPSPLEDCSDVRTWFLQTRGARALINGMDVRLGVDTPGSTSGEVTMAGEYKEEIALVLGGFARVRGQLPLTYLARVSDENGEALAYRALSGQSLLVNKVQREAFEKLPAAFRFKDAQAAYAKGPQATTDFLNKCLGLGILRKAGKTYEKLKVAE
jgi:hypothetical protein